jgi:hypothetical protein
MKSLSLALTAIALSLTACGGGGGSSSSTDLTSVPFTTANYVPPGRSAAATLVDVQASTAIDSLASAEASSGGSGSVASLAQAVYERARLGIAMDRVAASQTASQNCVGGGSVTVTANDNNNNGELDAGDSLSATFSACAMEVGEAPVSGGMDITVTSASQTSASLTVTLRALQSGGSTLNGSADLTASPGRIAITYRGATSTRGSAVTVYNYSAQVDLSGVRPVATLSGQIGISGAAYTLSTPTTIVYGTTWPSSGVLRIADAVGGRVDVVMRPTDFDLDLYLPGDATRDGRTTYTWAQLAAGAF